MRVGLCARHATLLGVLSALLALLALLACGAAPAIAYAAVDACGPKLSAPASALNGEGS